MSPLSDCSPGEWYLVVCCQNCKTRHPLFHDLSKGETPILATYRWTCTECGHKADYESEDLERYRHPCAQNG